ncbi:tetratricopeptide repeat protein [Sesbania bispinosa]|nr:tetratricopeptide repeat protein [Sesbania bispinosa]
MGEIESWFYHRSRRIKEEMEISEVEVHHKPYDGRAHKDLNAVVTSSRNNMAPWRHVPTPTADYGEVEAIGTRSEENGGALKNNFERVSRDDDVI